jgi:hypothetical protein
MWYKIIEKNICINGSKGISNLNPLRSMVKFM